MASSMCQRGRKRRDVLWTPPHGVAMLDCWGPGLVSQLVLFSPTSLPYSRSVPPRPAGSQDTEDSRNLSPSPVRAGEPGAGHR